MWISWISNFVWSFQLTESIWRVYFRIAIWFEKLVKLQFITKIVQTRVSLTSLFSNVKKPSNCNIHKQNNAKPNGIKHFFSWITSEQGFQNMGRRNAGETSFNYNLVIRHTTRDKISCSCVSRHCLESPDIFFFKNNSCSQSIFHTLVAYQYYQVQ